MISNGNNGDVRGEPEYPTSHKNEMERLERKAVQLGWVIPDTAKQSIVEGQIEIATDADQNPRARSVAAKTLVAMNSQNVQLAISRVDDGTDGVEGVDPANAMQIMRQTVPSRQ